MELMWKYSDILLLRISLPTRSNHFVDLSLLPDANASLHLIFSKNVKLFWKPPAAPSSLWLPPVCPASHLCSRPRNSRASYNVSMASSFGQGRCSALSTSSAVLQSNFLADMLSHSCASLFFSQLKKRKNVFREKKSLKYKSIKEQKNKKKKKRWKKEKNREKRGRKDNNVKKGENEKR